MNQGALQALTDILFFLHADTFPPKDFESQIIESINNGNDFGLFCYKFDKNKWYLNANAYFTQFKGFFCGGGDQGHFVKQTVFKKLKGFNENYDGLEDFDFYDRIKKHNYKVGLVRSHAIVSSRKYKRNSYLRVNLVNLASFFMYKLKVHPNKIKSFYTKYLHLQNE